MLEIAIVILLILIAVGVLLITEVGKNILLWILGIAVTGAILYMLFWVVVFWIAIFTSSTGQAISNGVGTFIGYIIFILIGIACIYIIRDNIRLKKKEKLEKKTLLKKAPDA
jgi:ABC-type transport system involved in multi-copper enzyme maturation permease subunit